MVTSLMERTSSRIRSSSAPRSSLVGSGKLKTVISLSNSAGISSNGDTKITVLKLFFRFRAISLSLRMTAKLDFAKNGWKSLKRKIAGSTCSNT